MKQPVPFALRAFLSIVLATFSLQAWGLDCAPASIFLRTQAEVDALSVTECTTVKGDLLITGSITSLLGLSNLANVGGTLYISDNDALTSLDGLEGLTSLGGLSIGGNYALTSLDGLANLTSVEHLSILGNAALTSLHGLTNLTYVGGGLFISNNDALTSLDGLEGLEGLEGLTSRLSIFDNAALTSLEGLSNLASVGGGLRITGNVSLTTLDGLSALNSVGGLQISSNANLSNLDGLSGISGVNGWLIIYNNAKLTNVDGLTNLVSVGDFLTIEQNNVLGNCSALALLLGWPDGPPNDEVVGNILIQNNATGCNSVQQILDSWPPELIFYDSFETSRVNTITRINASSVGLHTFIAIGSDGYPIISFGDQIAGSLRLIKCDGIKCDGAQTTIATIDVQGSWVGWPSAIAIGKNDFPIIAYSGNVSVWSPLLIAQCNDLACSGQDEDLSVADHPDFYVGYGISIVIGPDGFPIISHSTELEGVASLRVTKCNDPACSGDDETSTTLQDGIGGGATSMAIANDGFPVIANYNHEVHQLMVIKCDDLACTGGGESITVVTEDILGANLSLALGTDGFPVIAYQGNLGPALKVIKCNDLACAGNDETVSVVDNIGEDPGSYPRIAIGVDGNPIVAYWDRVGALGQLVVASCNDPACSGNDETITVVDGPSYVGQGISLAIGNDSLPIISYMDVGTNPDSIKVLHCGAANCAQ